MAASQSGRGSAPQVGEEFDSYDELKERVFNHGKATLSVFKTSEAYRFGGNLIVAYSAGGGGVLTC